MSRKLSKCEESTGTRGTDPLSLGEPRGPHPRPRDMPIMISDALDLALRQTRTPRPPPFPMSLLRPHEAQARKNHGQSLDELAARCGCSPCELLAIIEDRPYRRMDECEAIDRLAEHVARATPPRYRTGWS